MRRIRLPYAFLIFLVGTAPLLRAEEPSEPTPEEDLAARTAELHRKTVEALLDFANECVEGEIYSRARPWLEMARELSPDDPAIAEAMGREHPADDPRRPDRARSVYVRGRDRMLRGFLRDWKGFARWAERAGHAEAAHGAWERILEWDPYDADALAGLGRPVPGHVNYRALADGVPYEMSGLEGNRAAQDARKIFEATFPGALERVHERLGVTIQEGDDFSVRFVGSGSFTAHAVREGRSKVYIEINAPRWESLSGDETQAGTVIHESVHALCMLRMGPPYSGQPKWFREGLALFVAGQGPARVAWALRTTNNDIDRILDGLEPGRTEQDNPQDYAEAYLALRYLHDEIGEEAFREVCTDVIHRLVPVEEAIERATWIPFAEFEAAAHAFAREHHVRIASERGD